MNELMSKSNEADFLNLGFTREEDETGDPRGVEYVMKNDKFMITIDAWCDVYLFRLNHDIDQIQVVCNDLADLQTLIGFIQD